MKGGPDWIETRQHGAFLSVFLMHASFLLSGFCCLTRRISNCPSKIDMYICSNQLLKFQQVTNQDVEAMGLLLKYTR